MVSSEYLQAIQNGKMLSYKHYKCPLTPAIEKQLDQIKERAYQGLRIDIKEHDVEKVIKELEAELFPGNPYFRQVMAMDALIWIEQEYKPSSMKEEYKPNLKDTIKDVVVTTVASSMTT